MNETREMQDMLNRWDEKMPKPGESLPDGEYTAVIDEGFIAKNRDGDKFFGIIKMTVVEGNFSGNEITKFYSKLCILENAGINKEPIWNPQPTNCQLLADDLKKLNQCPVKWAMIGTSLEKVIGLRIKAEQKTNKDFKNIFVLGLADGSTQKAEDKSPFKDLPNAPSVSGSQGYPEIPTHAKPEVPNPPKQEESNPFLQPSLGDTSGIPF